MVFIFYIQITYQSVIVGDKKEINFYKKFQKKVKMSWGSLLGSSYTQSLTI